MDLGRLLRENATGGRTQFEKLEGDLLWDKGIAQLRQLRLDAGPISASGNVEAGEAPGVRGQLAVELSVSWERRGAGYALSGPLKAPYAGNIEWRRR